MLIRTFPMGPKRKRPVPAEGRGGLRFERNGPSPPSGTGKEMIGSAKQVLQQEGTVNTL